MKDNKVYIKHILDEVNYIIKATKDKTYENFLSDETLKRAIIRSLEIIGEATKNLSKDFREKYSYIRMERISGIKR